MPAPVFVVNPAFIQSLFAPHQSSMLLSQVQMDDMTLLAVGLVIGLIIIVVVVMMSMVGGLHVFD